MVESVPFDCTREVEIPTVDSPHQSFLWISYHVVHVQNSWKCQQSRARLVNSRARWALFPTKRCVALLLVWGCFCLDGCATDARWRFYDFPFQHNVTRTHEAHTHVHVHKEMRTHACAHTKARSLCRSLARSLSRAHFHTHTGGRLWRWSRKLQWKWRVHFRFWLSRHARYAYKCRLSRLFMYPCLFMCIHTYKRTCIYARTNTRTHMNVHIIPNGWVWQWMWPACSWVVACTQHKNFFRRLMCMRHVPKLYINIYIYTYLYIYIHEHM